MRNLLFFDIDGTLLPNTGDAVPQSAAAALARAQKAGNLVFINTGRTRGSVPASIEAVAPDGYVCGCGTAIYIGNERVFFDTLSPERCREIVRAVRRAALPTFFESEAGILYDGDAADAVQRDPHLLQARAVTYIPSVTLHEPLPDDLAFEKFLTFGTPKRPEAALKKIAGDDMEIICRENEMAEVTMARCSKATGIAWLAAHYGIPLENCYAFGDSTNDVTMLNAVPHSVAMGNSMPEILPLCEYVTSDILADGIANALAHYHLLGEN